MFIINYNYLLYIIKGTLLTLYITKIISFNNNFNYLYYY
uniref:Uncharacterized protein n=1 Tax=viral metagenome TaxID=1070528 RepID=A0A6C0H913_9ZZZZ